MLEVYKNLFVGTEDNCSFSPPIDSAIIHACKNPCHAKALGYKGSLPKTHPHYLIFENGRNLFLNMVDMELELSPIFTNPIMISAITFIEKHIKDKKILLHCNQGISRAPSIALLYLARIGVITNSNFQNAAIAFREKFPSYKPGKGMMLYMNRNWQTIIK